MALAHRSILSKTSGSVVVRFAVLPDAMSGEPVAVASVASALQSGTIALENLANQPLLASLGIPSSVLASSAVSGVAGVGQATDSQPTPSRASDNPAIPAKVVGVAIFGCCIFALAAVCFGRPTVRNMGPSGTPDLSAPALLPAGWSKEWNYEASKYVYYPTVNPNAPRRWTRPDAPPGPVERKPLSQRQLEAP